MPWYFTRGLMVLRGVAFVLGWIFVVQPAMGFLIAHVSALKAMMPGPADLLKARKLIFVEIFISIQAIALTLLVLLSEGRSAWRNGLFKRPARAGICLHGHQVPLGARWFSPC